jgi:1-acyl-sn-glycerol-3-phosphate acyltransferase
MIYVRSLLVNVIVVIWTFSCALVAVVLALGGRLPLMHMARIWGHGIQFLAKYIVGITYEIQDRHNIPKQGSYILACKHQSAWETSMTQILSFDSSIVLKHELMLIPLFGQVLVIAGAIGVNRRKGRRVLPMLIESAKKQVAKGRPIFIFPEGTRGQAGVEGKYRSGVYALYHHLNLPVIPVALNSGYFWPKRGFLKYPGKIIMKVLPAIEPGLTHEVFMKELSESIEKACKALPSRNNNVQQLSLKSNHECS